MASLANHAAGTPGGLRQCAIVEWFFPEFAGRYCQLYDDPERRCANRCHASGYKVPHTLEDVMDAYGLLECGGATPVPAGGAPPVRVAVADGVEITNGWRHEELRHLLDTGRAVALRVDPGRDGEASLDHFIVVVQFERDGEGIMVYDPRRDLRSPEPMSFSTLAQRHPVNWKYVTVKLP